MKELALLFLIFFGLTVQLTDSRQTVWPQPNSMTETDSFFVLDPAEFQFVATKHSNRILQEGFQRYLRIIFMNDGRPAPPQEGRNEGKLHQLTVEVESNDFELTLLTDESYSLTIDRSGGNLLSKTIFGALRGLETFSQLTHQQAVAAASQDRESSTVVFQCQITDFPRYAHRGLLIDTARHFLPVSVLLEHIDALAYNKFNVLHWHLVDDQSFPFQSERYPLLSERGAYRHDHIYTKHDVRKVVEYGHQRGVRVIPEFDTPGHVASWTKGYPELSSQLQAESVMDMQGNDLPLTCPLNPVGNFTYQFLEGLMAEVAELFPDRYVHVGGDEIPIDKCWKHLADEAHSTPHDLLANYERRLLEIMKRVDKEVILWEEVFSSGVPLPKGTVVALWKGQWQSKLHQVDAAGLKAIVYSPWYLNYISYGESWKNYYQIDLGDSPALLGGSAAIWHEFVDATNSVSRVWPFACAVGERLWSPSTTTDIDDAHVRLGRMRCSMVARGISAQPPTGPSFCDIEYVPAYSPPFGLEPQSDEPVLADKSSPSAPFHNLHHELVDLKAREAKQ